MFHDLEA
jgi:hypothetical protein